MNYIIHRAINLIPQINTCLLAAPPCTPDCEDCATRLADFAQSWTDSYPGNPTNIDRPMWVGTGYEPEVPAKGALQAWKDEIAKLREENDVLNRWKNEMMQVFAQTDFQELGKLMGLTIGNNVLPHLIPYIKEQQETLERIRIKCRPLIAATFELEREADYLHPYSAEVSETVSAFRAAVINYKKADEKA